MRTHEDTEFIDPNPCIECANVAAIANHHECMLTSCGGLPNGNGCRFNYEKKCIKHTVVGVMTVNVDQVEVHVLPRRTAKRMPNLNTYLLQYWRGNHDLTVLIDISHKIRYALKYVVKCKELLALIDKVVMQMEKRAADIIPPTMKQVLSNLFLASSAHKAFITKSELAYKVMDLPVIIKSFPNVETVGFYHRATLIEKYKKDNEEDIIEFSDRTKYSAYGDRNKATTVLVNFDEESIASLPHMNYRNFVQ
jgi:hypothetical protein